MNIADLTIGAYYVGQIRRKRRTVRVLSVHAAPTFAFVQDQSDYSVHRINTGRGLQLLAAIGVKTEEGEKKWGVLPK